MLSKNPTQVLTDAMRQYIDANAGMFASEAEAYIPGMVGAIMAAFSHHGLHVVTIPAVPPPATNPQEIK